MLKTLFYPVGFKGNLSLLEICVLVIVSCPEGVSKRENNDLAIEIQLGDNNICSFLGWEASHTKIDHRQKVGTLILISQIWRT